MKYAYLNRNLKKLSFEEQVVFFSHLATLLFCFFPWISVEPLYDEPYWNSAFSGPGTLIGVFIFGVSLLVVLYFLDRILESKRINFPFDVQHLFYGAGIEQMIFLILSWSVLLSVSREFENSEIRFGVFACVLTQIVGLVATYLYSQTKQKKEVQSFFQHPTPPKNASVQKSTNKDPLKKENTSQSPHDQ
jgi:hypothetical protein